MALLSLRCDAQNYPPGRNSSTGACIIVNANPCSQGTYITLGSGDMAASAIRPTVGTTIDTLQAFVNTSAGGSTTGISLAIYSNAGASPGSRLAFTSGTLSTCYGGKNSTCVYGGLNSQIFLTNGVTYWVVVEYTGNTTSVCALDSNAGFSLLCPSGCWQTTLGNFQYRIYSNTSGLWDLVARTWIVEVGAIPLQILFYILNS